MKLLRPIILSIILFSPSAFGEDRGIMMFEFSESSCGVWAKSASNVEQRQLYLFWIRGFISGYNAGVYQSGKKSAQVNRMPDNDTVALYVDKFCRDNPLDQFIKAAFLLRDDLRNK